jgi:hypothetical protein
VSDYLEHILHPLTLERIKTRDGSCGCEKRGDRWSLCPYHMGFDDGAEAAVRAVAEGAP